MYGATTSEWLGFMAFIAIVGGALAIGGEHLVVWLWHHVSVGLK